MDSMLARLFAKINIYRFIDVIFALIYPTGCLVKNIWFHPHDFGFYEYPQFGYIPLC